MSCSRTSMSKCSLRLALLLPRSLAEGATFFGGVSSDGEQGGGAVTIFSDLLLINFPNARLVTNACSREASLDSKAYSSE